MYKTFWDYLNRVNCIEDLVVLSYSCIFNEFDSTKERLYKPEAQRDLENHISIYFENQLYMRSNAIELLKTNIIELHKKRNFTFNDMYCIIKVIDTNYEYTNKRVNLGFDNFFSYQSLSIMSKEPEIFLLPKHKGSFVDIFNKHLKAWEKSKGQKEFGLRKTINFDNNSINTYLTNFIIIHSNEINNNKLCMHELNYRNKEINFINDIIKRGYFKTLVVPTTKRPKNELFITKMDDKYFWIDGMKESMEEYIYNIYISNMQKYKYSDVNFIIFPEMLLTKNNLNRIQQFLQNSYTGEPLQIYILGSYWDNYSNETVAIASDGEIIFKQSKKVAFKYGKLTEKLLNDDKTIHILDFENFSRINTFICKEINDDKLMSIPKRLESNLIFAPSFSMSLNMKNIPINLATSYHCTTIMANSCSPVYNDSAVQDNKKIGFICQPSKNNTDSHYEIIDYTFEEKCTNCKNNCDGYILTIKFDQLMDENKKTFKTYIERNTT